MIEDEHNGEEGKKARKSMMVGGMKWRKGTREGMLVLGKNFG